MKYFPKLVGEKIYLAPMSAEDAEQYAKWINDSNLSDCLGNSSLISSLEKEKDIIDSMIREGYNFAIVRREDDQLLGNISFFEVNQIHRNAMCGLFIGEAENRGQGYGKEALRLLLRFGFQTLNLNNVMLKVYAFNEMAIACYRKLGFKVIGERRDAYFVRGKYHNEILMDILAGEFED